MKRVCSPGRWIGGLMVNKMHMPEQSGVMHEAVREVEVSIMNKNCKRDADEEIDQAAFMDVKIQLSVTVFYPDEHSDSNQREDANAAHGIKKLFRESFLRGIFPLYHAVLQPLAQQHPQQQECAAGKYNVAQAFASKINRVVL